jgi:excisionase family DNA binding protein
MKVRCGLLTAQQAAEHLGVSRKTYYERFEKHVSPAVFRFRRIFFERVRL